MNFKFNVTKTTTTEGGSKKEVDWDKLHEHIISAAGTEKKARSIPGVISGIYDLGEQNRGDAEIDVDDAEFRKKFPEYDGSDSSKKLIASKRNGSYFKDEAGKTFYCYPQKAVQQVAIAVDFPQILVDKGQFFGKSNKLPLRMLLNGEFSINKERIVGKPFSIVEKKYDDGVWAFAKNNGLHKLADAVEILDERGYFTKDRIGELLGKVALFKMRVWMKPAKTGDKKFFTEEISLSGPIPEGVNVPEYDESILHGVNLYGENDEESVKQLRLCVKNTIARANNFEGSDIQKMLEKLSGNSGSSGGSQNHSPKPAASNVAVKQEKQEEVEQEDEDFSSECPF